MDAAVRALLEGRVEGVAVARSRPEPPSTAAGGEIDLSPASLRRNIVEIKAMMARLLDLVERGVSQAPQQVQGDAADKCPYCGQNFRGNLVKMELLNVHIPIPRIGIELLYRACPSCEKPLTQITWKPIQQG